MLKQEDRYLISCNAIKRLNAIKLNKYDKKSFIITKIPIAQTQ